MPELNVYQKINEVKKVVKILTKDGETSGKGAYSYVTGTQIFTKIKEKMEEVGLLFLPVGTEHREYRTFDYKNSYGETKTDFLVDGTITYEWINIDKPEDRQRVEFQYYGQQNDLSKAFGSALTYSERYLLLKSLGVPTDEDDPDRKNEDKKGASPQRPKPTQPPAGQGSPGKGGERETRAKSKWAILNDLIKDSSITLASVNEWIQKKWGKPIKINDLSDEQFATLSSAVKKQIAQEEGDE